MSELYERFYPVGRQWENAGVRYRILAGTRGVNGNDKIIEFSICNCHCGVWHRPTISHAQTLFNFKYEVEENNYPRAHGFDGGIRLLASYIVSFLYGPQREAERIKREAEAAAKKRLMTVE